MRALLLPTIIAALFLSACEVTAPKADADTPAPPLFDTFGALHRDIGSPVPGAQRYFDQGLRLAYGFNHEAAARAFAEAERLDPSCAMCVWGQALVLGPNINLPMATELAPQATDLARKAQSLASGAKPADRALINALVARYKSPAPADRKPLDRAYADAMAQVVAQFPGDDDAAALYAESLMDLTPWNYWSPAGTATGDTPIIVAQLEKVIARNPQHIGAIHYYIHAVEASKTPERAEAIADTLADLAPGSGHLVHMPAHVYIRTGRYHDATLINFRASTADKAFLAVCHGTNGVYPLGYVPHNWHFAAMTASLHGSRELALQAADQTAQRADHAQLDTINIMQNFVIAPLYAKVRFAQWDDILAMDKPPADRPYPTGAWHFARGMAYARTGHTAFARKDLATLAQIAKDPAMEKLVLGEINRADKLLSVAEAMLRGEIALAEKKPDAGIAALREAAAIEDTLNYNEPADWPLPVRPYLGAALLAAGKPQDAARVYNEDLATYPKNGWSLFGLAQAQRAIGDEKAAEATDAAQKAAWQWADTPLTASAL